MLHDCGIPVLMMKFSGYHDLGIYISVRKNVRTNDCKLIGIVHMTECLADGYLFVRDKELCQFEQDAPKCFEMSEQEFSELEGNVLAYLNGE